MAWRPTDLEPHSGRTLVLGGSAALQRLAAQGVTSSEMPLEEEPLLALLRSEPWSTVVLADGLSTSSAWAKAPAPQALPGGELSDVAVLNRAMILTKAGA